MRMILCVLVNTASRKVALSVQRGHRHCDLRARSSSHLQIFQIRFISHCTSTLYPGKEKGTSSATGGALNALRLDPVTMDTADAIAANIAFTTSGALFDCVDSELQLSSYPGRSQLTEGPARRKSDDRVKRCEETYWGASFIRSIWLVISTREARLQPFIDAACRSSEPGLTRHGGADIH